MVVYRRENSATYSYDFRFDGSRYSGSTGTSDSAEAAEFEQRVRESASGIGLVARAVLRRAYRREWFFLCGKLKQFVAELRRSGGDKQAARQKVPQEVTLGLTGIVVSP